MLLLDGGFPLDAPGELEGTALHHAAWWGRPDNVELLLERGANGTEGPGPGPTPPRSRGRLTAPRPALIGTATGSP
jgi:ankyrin repeat protein